MSLIQNILDDFTIGKTIDSIFKKDKGQELSNQIDIAINNYRKILNDEKDINLFDKTNFEQFGKASGVITKQLEEMAKAGQLVNMSAEDIAKSFSAMGTSTVKASLKQMATNVVWNLGASAIIALASTLITVGISALNDYIHKQDEIIKSGKDAAESLKTQREALQNNASWVKENSDRYAELSQGVKNGINQSLTTSEFDEFKKLNSELANMFPELITGYSSMGVAILNTANAQDTLNTKLKEQKHELAANARKDEKKIVDAYEETLQSYTGLGDTLQTGAKKDLLSKITKKGKNGEDILVGYEDFLKQLGKSDDAAVEDLLKQFGIEGKKTSAALAAQTGAFSWTISEEDYDTFKKSYTTYKNEITKELEQDSKDIKNNMVDQLFNYGTFESMSEKAQQGIASIIQSMNPENFVKHYQEKGGPSKWLDSMFKGLDKDKVQNKLDNLLSLDKSQLNMNNLVDYNALADDVAKMLKLTPEDIENFKINLGIDEEAFDSSLNAAKNNIVSKFSDLGVKNNYTKEIRDAYNEYVAIKKDFDNLGIENKTVFGNIDLDNRQTIEWTKKNLNQYKDALMSWARDGQTWKDVQNEFKGSISTVFGSSANFDGVEIAFSPMLQTEHGAELLSSDTVHKYINSLIDKASEGDGKWTNEELFKLDTTGLEVDGKNIKGLLADIGDTEYINSLIDKASEGDGKWTNEELFKLDTTGLEVDGKNIKGLLADIGDTAIKTGEAMHFLGKDGALSLAEQTLSNVADKAGLSVEKIKETLAQDDTGLMNWLNTLSQTDLDIIGNLDMSGMESLEEVKAVLKKIKETLAQDDTGLMNWLNTLSQTDLDIIGNLDMSGMESLEEVKAVLNKIKADSQISIDIAVNAEKIEKLKGIFSESNGAIGLTQASINEMVNMFGDDAYAALEKTAVGVKLNSEAFDLLVEKQENATKSKYLETLEKQNSALEQARKELKETGISYEDVKNNADEATRASDKWQDAVSATVKIDTLTNQIQQTQLLISQYDGLTNAYNKWINAQETENKNSHMQKAREGLETAKKSYKDGWTTEDDYTTYMDYIGSYKKSDDNYVKNADKNFKRAEKYLTENSEGAHRFADAIKALGKEYVTTDESGKKFTFDIDKIAQKMNMTTAFVTDMISAMGGAGYEVNLDDAIDTTALEELSKKADTAKESLQKLKEENKTKLNIDLEYDVDNMSVEALIAKKAELERYKGSADFDSSELENIDALISEITAKLAYLEQTNIDINITGQEEINILAEKIASIPKGETANIHVNVENEEQIESVTNELAKIPPDVEANVSVEVPDGDSEKVDALKKKIEELNENRGKPIVLDVQTKGQPDTKGLAKGLVEPTVEQHISIKVDNKDDLTNLQKQLSELKETYNCEIKLGIPELLMFSVQIQQLQTLTATPITIDIDVTTAQSNLDSVKSILSQLNTVTGKPKVDVDIVTATSQVGKIQALINALKGKTVTVQVDPKDSHTILNGILNKIRSINSKTVTITTEYNTVGAPAVNGTAHAHGTTGSAFAKGTIDNKGKALKSGDWGLKEDVDKALMGELGPEIVVRDGKWMTVGDHGAEFVGGLKRGDIIFNHKQSEELLNKGYVTSSGGRGRALAEGTAFAGFKDTNLIHRPSKTSKKKKPSRKSKDTNKTNDKSKSSTNDAKKAAENLVDWIAVLLEYVARQTKLAVDAIDDAVGLVAKQTATNKAISQLQNEIAQNQKAKDAYLKQANSVGLSADYKKKIESGTLNIENVKDENLKKKIDDYTKWYKEAEKCSDAILDLQRQEKEMAQRRLENIEEWYDAIINVNKSMIDVAEAKQELNEALGTAINHELNTSEINKAIKEQTDTYNQLVKKLAEYQAEFDKQVSSGLIKENSDAWFEGKEKINEFSANIFEASKELIEFKDKLQQIEYDTIQNLIDGLDRVVSSIDSKIELLEARDEKVPETLYKEQFDNNNEQIKLKYDLRNKKLQEQALYDVNSVRYQELAKEIADIDEETRQLLIDNEKLKDSIFELRFAPLDKEIEKYKELRSETDAFYKLLNEEAFFDKNGIITEDGLAGLALLQQGMATAKQEIADYKVGLDKLQQSLDNNVISQEEYDEKSKEYINGIQDAVANVKDYEKSLTDLYMTQLKTEVDALDKIIQKRKEALDKKAEYYEYDKRLRNESRDVNLLKAQIAAMEGSTNTASQAELKRLKEQLKEAEDKLGETKREHALDMEKEGYDGISEDMQKMLEDTEYEILHNADKQQQIIQNMLNNVVGMYESAYDKINSIIGNTGWVGSNEFNQNQSQLGSQSGAQSQKDNATQNQSNVKPSGTANGTVTDKIGSTDNSNFQNKVETDLDKKPNTDNRPVAELKITPTAVTLQEGSSKSVQVSIRPNDAKNKTLKWESSNPKIATASGGVVKGVAPGSCQIIASTTDGSGISATISVNVTKKPEPPKPNKPVNKPTNGTGDGIARVGDKVTLKKGQRYYYDSYGKRPAGSRYAGVKNGVIIDSYSGSKYGGKTKRYGNYGVHIKSADGKYGDLGWVRLDQLEGYAQGSKKINEDKFAWTNENGRELIIRKSDGAVLTHLNAGDGVIPNNLTENLFKWGAINPSQLILDKLNANTSAIVPNEKNINIEFNYDNFLNIDGGTITKDSIPAIKDIAKEITPYITDHMYKELKKKGF